MKIGANEYRLCGLDTNVVSEIAKDPKVYLAGLQTLLGPGGFLMCFSPYSLFELRCRPDVYQKFVQFFDVFPCALLKNEEQLFEEERKHFPDPSAVDPLLLGFSFLNTKKGTNLRNVLEVALQAPEVQRREQEWPALKEELLSDWLRLKQNFPPRGRHYQILDAANFMMQATPQHVMSRAPDWFRASRSAGHSVSWRHFPSVAMTLLTVFFRLYEPRGRRAVPQDVFDVLISTPTPYLDLVVTENMQAQILSKSRRVFGPIKNVDVFTLRNVRAAA